MGVFLCCGNDPIRHAPKVARTVSWSAIATKCGEVYADGPGTRLGEAEAASLRRSQVPPLPTRLMAGLAILKFTFDLSDEELCARWIENPFGGKTVHRTVF